MENSVTDFRKKYRVKNSKKDDERIRDEIIKTLSEMSQSTDIKEYKDQIDDRINLFKLIFENFEQYMEDLELKRRLDYNNKRKKTISSQTVLDRYIQKRISEVLDTMYEEIHKKTSSSNSNLNSFLCQILDRKIRIEYLLDDYDENIKYIQRENSNDTKQVNSMEITHDENL